MEVSVVEHDLSSISSCVIRDIPGLNALPDDKKCRYDFIDFENCEEKTEDKIVFNFYHGTLVSELEQNAANAAPMLYKHFREGLCRKLSIYTYALPTIPALIRDCQSLTKITLSGRDLLQFDGLMKPPLELFTIPSLQSLKFKNYSGLSFEHLALAKQKTQFNVSHLSLNSNGGVQKFENVFVL